MSSVFSGFPTRSRFISLPEAFITDLLPEMDDAAEIKTTLFVLRALYLKRGYPRFLTQGEMDSNRELVEMVGGLDKLLQVLSQAVQRGTLLRLAVGREEHEYILYFLNDETSRLAIEKVAKGQLALGKLAPLPPLQPAAEPTHNIYSLYENNIGLLTPMAAEELKEAEKLYPAAWIEDAFKEAVAQNKRRWSYISRILERWAEEGRGDGTAGRYPKKDPNKYIKGRYGHIVRR